MPPDIPPPAVSSPPGPSPRRTLPRGPILLGLLFLGCAAAVGGGTYWVSQQRYVFTDKADVEAPLIKLAPHAPGELKKVYVDQGDAIPAYRAVARVGDEMLLSQVAGTAVIVKKDIGTLYQPGQAVVTMIDPRELRVIARIDEDKGLANVRVGQQVSFTVDAFGSRAYEGEVEAVSQTNREGDVVFNISDKRQEKEFDVKIRYDLTAYPELQNGMSARVWIEK